MRNFFGIFAFCSLLAVNSLSAEVKRTDGPKGSEYGDPETLPGELQIGLHFGALMDRQGSKDSSFTLGGDIDWRPYDLFGFRISSFQSLQKPRSTLIALTPLAHSEFSNLRPYALFGPGVGIMRDSLDDLSMKFMIVLGVGADVMLTDHIGLGMEYSYNSVFDFDDLHLVGARVLYSF